MSKKDLYFESLVEIEHLPLFLSADTNHLSQEIQANCVCLSVPGTPQIKATELFAFLQRVKYNRQQQLRNSELKVNLIYYVWHDEMAGQLRFNLINSCHRNLPFGCTISLVDNEVEIVADFLNSNYLQGISWEELAAIDGETARVASDASAAAITCKVYQEIIFHSSATLPHSLYEVG